MIKSWYKEGVVYQIYPRSFNDSNNDGIGDINGIIEKLDYIKDLGATIVWLSPIYASPLDDNGYDISDYYQIHPDYGTMDDFKRMLSEMHKRGIKLIMDLVVNHTSDEHYWFQEAKKSKDNPYRDYYIWRPGKKNKFPNNWKSFFGGDAWKYDETTDEYYLHLFSPKQPDLNWENEHVRAEVKKILKFWLDLGVDGFRCDVINILSKKEGLPNGKFDLFLTGKEQYLNGPKMHQYLQELKDDVLSKYDCFTVGEGCFITPEIALSYVSEDRLLLNMMFQFDHMNADVYFIKWFIRKFRPVRLKKALSKWQYALNGKGWNALYFENHDQPRSVSRFGDEEYREKSAKMLATFLFFQQGTPYIYQGQEIGMTNPHFKTLEDYEDVETHNIYRIGRKSLHFSHKRMMKKIEYMSRDNARTPMPWNGKPNGGFTTATPWFHLNPNFKEINVAKDLKEESSIIRYYQQITALRKKYSVIVYGDYQEHFKNSNKIICYERNLEGEHLLVVANYTTTVQKFTSPIDLTDYKIILNNYDDDFEYLLPYQAKVYYKGE